MIDKKIKLYPTKPDLVIPKPKPYIKSAKSSRKFLHLLTQFQFRKRMKESKSDSSFSPRHSCWD